MHETSLINIIALHALSIFAVVLFLVSTTLLYPIENFANALSVCTLFLIVGVVLMYKKPFITKIVFLTTVTGAVLTIATYILTTNQDWTAFTFVFTLLGISCFLLLLLALRF